MVVVSGGHLLKQIPVVEHRQTANFVSTFLVRKNYVNEERNGRVETSLKD